MPPKGTREHSTDLEVLYSTRTEVRKVLFIHKLPDIGLEA